MDLRERIINDSVKLFFTNGLRAVTMDDVAKEVGISKRTLYEVFSDKEQLLREVSIYFFKLKRMEEEKHFRMSVNCIETLMIFYTYALKSFNILNIKFMREMRRFYPSVYELYENESEKNIKIQIEMLEKGQAEGLIREDINVGIASLLTKIQFEMFWNTDVFTMHNFDLREVVRTIIINFVRGIATPTGLEYIERYLENEKN